MTRLVHVYRGDHIESWHSGAVVVVDSGGVLRAVAGDPTMGTFIRSAAKPFQVLPLLSAGGAEEYDLTDEEVALICASHGGEPQHVATAAALLRKGDLDEGDLQCGAHMPYDRRAAADLRQSGELPGALHNNCSGKHSGMLLACRLLDHSTADYLEAQHPLQQEIHEILATFCGVPAQQLPVAVDGCGVPTWFMSLYRAAAAYARVAATAAGAEGGIAELEEEALRATAAMTGNPHFVAGSWSLTTPLMQAFRGSLLAKDGAEGFYAMAIQPERASRLRRIGSSLRGRALGIAVKIADGSARRGRDQVVLRVLEQLGCDETSGAEFESYRRQIIRNVAGRDVGHVAAAFELAFL